MNIMACFQNRQTLATGVRPSPGAATSVGQERMELRKNLPVANLAVAGDGHTPCFENTPEIVSCVSWFQT